MCQNCWQLIYYDVMASRLRFLNCSFPSKLFDREVLCGLSSLTRENPSEWLWEQTQAPLTVKERSFFASCLPSLSTFQSQLLSPAYEVTQDLMERQKPMQEATFPKTGRFARIIFPPKYDLMGWLVPATGWKHHREATLADGKPGRRCNRLKKMFTMTKRGETKVWWCIEEGNLPSMGKPLSMRRPYCL